MRKIQNFSNMPELSTKIKNNNLPDDVIDNDNDASISTPNTVSTNEISTTFSAPSSAATNTTATSTSVQNSSKIKSAISRNAGNNRRGCKLIEAKSKRNISPSSSTDTTTSSSSSTAAIIGSSSRQSASTTGNQSNSYSGVGGDSLFEPSVEMMVNDFDDERTLEEEEALAATEAEDPSAELSSLQRVCKTYM